MRFGRHAVPHPSHVDTPPEPQREPDPIEPNEDQERAIEFAFAEMLEHLRQLSIKPIESIWDGTLWADPPEQERREA